MRRIDEWLLNLFQGVSDWAHAWTGSDCIHHARICAAMTAAAWLSWIVVQRIAGWGFDWIAAICMLGQLSRAFWETDADSLARRAAAMGYRNPRRVQTGGLLARTTGAMLAFAVTLLGLITGWLPLRIMSVILPAWAALEFESCDVQAPRTGRLREVLKALKAGQRWLPLPSTVWPAG